LGDIPSNLLMSATFIGGTSATNAIRTARSWVGSSARASSIARCLPCES